MRIIPASIVLSIAMTTGAAASSFVTLDAEERKISPSMIVLGEAPVPELANLGAPPPVADSVAPYEAANPEVGDFTPVSPSIIAMEEPVPPVTYEQVAAIEEDEEREESAKRRILDMPMVIRGGIVGDSFPRASAGEPTVAEESVPVEPQQEERSADARGGKPEPKPQRPAAKPERATSPAISRGTSVLE